MGSLSHAGILDVDRDWLEDYKFGTSPTEVSRAKEAPPYSELPENEKKYACSQMDRVVLWGSTADGKLLCGSPRDKLQRPLKVKEDQVSSQR